MTVLEINEKNKKYDEFVSDMHSIVSEREFRVSKESEDMIDYKTIIFFEIKESDIQTFKRLAKKFFDAEFDSFEFVLNELKKSNAKTLIYRRGNKFELDINN